MCYPGGGESTDMVVQRARDSLTTILERYPASQHIALVAHGRFNKVLLASLIYNDVSQFKTIKQGNTCINVLDYDPVASSSESKWSTKNWKPIILNYLNHADVPDRYRN